MQEDIKLGLIPFFVSTTLGTTSCCSFDNLEEIGPICEKNNLWLHVDAAYAGNSFICPEFQYIMKGINVSHRWIFSFNCLLLTQTKSLSFTCWKFSSVKRTPLCSMVSQVENSKLPSSTVINRLKGLDNFVPTIAILRARSKVPQSICCRFSHKSFQFELLTLDRHVGQIVLLN